MKLELKNISFGYPDRTLGTVDSFCLDSGRVHFLLGKNGIGKSTLFKTLAGITPQLSSGELLLDRADILQLSRKRLADKVSYIHRTRIRSRITLGDFLRIGLSYGKLGRSSRAEVDTQLAKHCERFGLHSYLDQSIHVLSDGEYQKALITLSLLRDCPVILLDEPLSHLDPPSQIEMMRLFEDLAQDHLVWMSIHNLQTVKDSDGSISVLNTNGELLSVEKEALATSHSFSSFYR